MRLHVGSAALHDWLSSSCSSCFPLGFFNSCGERLIAFVWRYRCNYILLDVPALRSDGMRKRVGPDAQHCITSSNRHSLSRLEDALCPSNVPKPTQATTGC